MTTTDSKLTLSAGDTSAELNVQCLIQALVKLFTTGDIVGAIVGYFQCSGGFVVQTPQGKITVTSET